MSERPVSGLPALLALGGRLDAVRDRVAEHVLERRQHALEHLPVDLAGLALDDELGVLAGVGRRLADDAREPLRHAVGTAPCASHQAVLQLGVTRACCVQQGLRLVA